MSQRRAWTIASMLLMVLALLRPGSAGIGEWIWEMSGPSMVGVGLECKLALDGDLERCYIVGATFRDKGTRTDTRFRVSLESGVYFSLGKNAGGQDYEFGKTWMLTFDPMFEMVTKEKQGGNFAVYHGLLGVSYNLLLGSEFRRFTNAAFKLRPLGVSYKRVNFEYNLRVYPNGFSADEFGKLPLVPEANRAEAVHGFSIGIAIN